MAAKKGFLVNGNRTLLVLSAISAVLVAGIYLMPGGGVTGYAALHVCSAGCAFTTIQPAIDAAIPGDVIYICSRAGVDPWYTENVNITKSLTLVANTSCTYGPVWINASNIARPTVNISANNVNMTGFIINSWSNKLGAGQFSRSINLEKARNVTLERMTIYNGYSNVYFDSSTNVSMMDMLINGSDYENIHVYNSSNISIDTSKIYYAGTYAAYIGSLPGQPPSKNVYIRGNEISGNSNGIYVDSNSISNRTEVINNTIITSDDSGSVAFIDFNTGYFHRVVNNTLNATGSGGSRVGIYLLNTVNMTIADNRMINVTDTGIDVDGTFENNTIANNTFSKSTEADGYYYLFLDGTGSYNLIENNTFTNVNDSSGGTAILYISGSVINSAVRMNKIYDSTFDYGIKNYGNGNIIERNTIRGVFNGYIFVDSDGTEVRNNTIEMRKTTADCEGIHDDGSSGSNYSYNTIYSDNTPSDMASCYGIFSYGGEGGSIRYNAISNVGIGIYFGGWEIMYIYNNTLNHTLVGANIDYYGANFTNNTIEDAQRFAISATNDNTGVNITGNRLCKNALGFYNTTSGAFVDGNIFCVLPSSPASGATVASLTDFRFNASNPVFWAGVQGGRRNTTCQLYIDGTFAARNSSVYNNNASVIAYSTLPAAGAHSWYVYCNDSAGTNSGNSSVMSFTVQAADGSACSADSDCTSNHCVHGTCRADSTYCGDDYCDSGETTATCAADCPSTSTYVPPPKCKELCPEPTMWSSGCANVTGGVGVQTRYAYKCTASTGWLCEQYEDVQSCEVSCNCLPPGPWYDCYLGVQQRQNFKCDETTDWKCNDYVERIPCADACAVKPSDAYGPCTEGKQEVTLFYCNSTTHKIWWNYTEEHACVSASPAGELPRLIANTFFRPQTSFDWTMILIALLVIASAIIYTYKKYRKAKLAKQTKKPRHAKKLKKKLTKRAKHTEEELPNK